MTPDINPERTDDWRDIHRRSILKAIGAGVVLGGMAGNVTAVPNDEGDCTTVYRFTHSCQDRGWNGLSFRIPQPCGLLRAEVVYDDLETGECCKMREYQVGNQDVVLSTDNRDYKAYRLLFKGYPKSVKVYWGCPDNDRVQSCSYTFDNFCQIAYAGVDGEDSCPPSRVMPSVEYLACNRVQVSGVDAGCLETVEVCTTDCDGNERLRTDTSPAGDQNDQQIYDAGEGGIIKWVKLMPCCCEPQMFDNPELEGCLECSKKGCDGITARKGGGQADENYTLAPDELWKARARGETNGRLYVGPDDSPTAVDADFPENTWMKACINYDGAGEATMKVTNTEDGDVEIMNSTIPVELIDAEACEVGFTIAAARNGVTNLRNVTWDDSSGPVSPPIDRLNVRGRSRVREKYLILGCVDPTKPFEVKYDFRFRRFGRGNDRFPSVRFEVPGYPDGRLD